MRRFLTLLPALLFRSSELLMKTLNNCLLTSNFGQTEPLFRLIFFNNKKTTGTTCRRRPKLIFDEIFPQSGPISTRPDNALYLCK